MNRAGFTVVGRIEMGITPLHPLWGEGRHAAPYFFTRAPLICPQSSQHRYVGRHRTDDGNQ